MMMGMGRMAMTAVMVVVMVVVMVMMIVMRCLHRRQLGVNS
jgi:hypothetical protein